MKIRKNKISWLLVFILTISFINALDYQSSNLRQIHAQASQSDPVSREWLMDYYGLTEEEVQDYDIDMILRNGYLASKEKTMERHTNKENILEVLPWFQEKAYEKEFAEELKILNDFSYLLEGNDDFPDDYGQIKYLGIESVWDDRQPSGNDPTGIISVLFDFDQNKAYFKNTDESVLDDLRNAHQVLELKDEQKEEILSLLEEADLSDWPAYQTTEHQYDNWSFGIETQDGQVFSNMLEDLPNNPKAMELFSQLFSYQMYSPRLTK